MINILLYILQVLLLITLVLTMVLFLLWSFGNFKNKVPFVTSSKSVFKYIGEALSVDDNSIVYDLGCGDGRILFYLSQINKKARYIGIENSIFPLILARAGSFLNFKKEGVKVEIIDNSFFEQDLSDATHVFTYLYPTIMDQLLPKFQKELKPGTTLVSLSFKFRDKQPLSEIDLKRGKYKLGRKLYIYKF